MIADRTDGPTRQTDDLIDRWSQRKPGGADQPSLSIQANPEQRYRDIPYGKRDPPESAVGTGGSTAPRHWSPPLLNTISVDEP